MSKREKLIQKQREILAKIHDYNIPENYHEYDVPFIYRVPQEVVDKLWIEFDKIYELLKELDDQSERN